MYRHALPPGFVLKKDKKKEEKQDEISLEDLIEKEVKLSGTLWWYLLLLMWKMCSIWYMGFSEAITKRID